MKFCHSYGIPAEALSKILVLFKQNPNIEKVWLYGSRALGTYRQGSDIDLCIEGTQLTIKDLLKIDNQLDDLLLPWKIDLSLKHQINNQDLIQHISQHGITIYARIC